MGTSTLHGKIAITPKRDDGSPSYSFLFHLQSPYREISNPKHVYQNNLETLQIRVCPECTCIGFRRFYKKMTEKKPSTFDIPCLGLSFAIAWWVLFNTDSEYPISTALDCFLSAMLLFGWLRLAVFVVRWRVTRTTPYWRWNSIILHIACCFALGGRVVLEGGGPGLVAAGEILEFTGVWLCKEDL